MGIVNLFGDTTYEGGASINGQFLGSLGASAAAISIIAGAGEFLGYSLRSVAGWTADKTGRYWPITFVGFAINLFAVPAMALAGNWQVAGLLILAERIGRAIRKPTVEAMLSYSTGQLGTGWVYALNTALDETGATIGPLFMAFALYRHASYRAGYSLLLISAALAFVALAAARIRRLAEALAAFYERTEPWWRAYEREPELIDAWSGGVERYYRDLESLMRGALDDLADDETAVAVVAAVIGPPTFFALRARGISSTEAVDLGVSLAVPWLEGRRRSRRSRRG